METLGNFLADMIIIFAPATVLCLFICIYGIFENRIIEYYEQKKPTGVPVLPTKKENMPNPVYNKK